ncbi:MAG: transcriptional regulator HexR [Cellvibrionales bacterium]|nr:transcriptional regulator HexR [Cellvibrionales bacterium]
MSLLALLQSPSLRLSKAERKVAAAVLAAPEAIIHAPIAQVAGAAAVSEPTVNRFCRRLCCKGYPDFKVKLAQELSAEPLRMVRDVLPTDDVASLVGKIFDATTVALQCARASAGRAAIERAVDALAQARSILFFGLGASGPVALDAQHKFFRCNMPVVAHTDILNQRMACAGLGAGEVAVFISYTGRTIALVDNARLARQSGATVIGITADGSPLAAECGVVLGVDIREDTEVYTPMSSRIVHLVLVDILVAAVALRRGPPFAAHLKKIKDSLRVTRYPQGKSTVGRE